MSGKVSTDRLTKGASVSRYVRMEMSVRRNGRTEKTNGKSAGEVEKNLFYGEQHFSIYGKIII